MILLCWDGEGNGNPLQNSCLENFVDRGAWWAAVQRVAQSRTRLKQLSMHACIGEGNDNPLQYSCLENPREKEPGGLPSLGLHSQTRLKWRSSSSSSSSSVLRSSIPGWHGTTAIWRLEQGFPPYLPIGGLSYLFSKLAYILSNVYSWSLVLFLTKCTFQGDTLFE